MLWLVLLFVLILVVSVIAALVALSPYCVRNYQIVIKNDVSEKQRLLFQTLTNHLNAANIPYWVVRDTLVDVVDHKTLAKNRDVLSIAVPREFDRQLLHLKPTANAKLYFVLQRIPDGYMCYINNMSDFPCIHISVMEQRDHEVLPCTSHDAFDEFTHSDNHHLRAEIYLVRDVFPLREMTVEKDLVVCVPQNAQTCATIFSSNNSTQPPALVKMICNQRTKNIWANLSTVLST